MIAILAKSIREYRRESLLAPGFVTLEVVMDVIIPYLMARIIDQGIAAADLASIWRIGGMLIACAILSLTFGVASGRYAAVASAGFAKNLRHDMYRAIQGFAYADIDRFSTASLVTRLTTDVSNVQDAYQMLVRIMVRSPLMLAFSLAMAFKVNARVSLVFLAVAPVLGVGLYLIIIRAHPIFATVMRTYDRLNTVVRENLAGIRAVKAYVREDQQIGLFNAVSAEIFAGFTKAEKLLALNSPLMQFAMYSCTLLLSWLGARMIVSGSMSTGQLMGLLTYATQILMSLMMFSMVLMMVTVSRASAVRIAEVLETDSSMPPVGNAVVTVADGSVAFRKATFGYGDCDSAMCLRDIDLDFAAGETIGVIGGTGSGKTTLVQLIPRLYDVMDGAVLVGGVDVRRYDPRVLHDRVAMVPQNNRLFAGSVRDNLRWGAAGATDAELDRVCRLSRADEFVPSLPGGYDYMIEQGGANLSGGQRQRLCIARALLKNPLVLILDDSTSAIDAKNDEMIRRAFREELPGMTRIIIAQRAASVMDADRIVVMDAGRIDAVGAHAELLENNAIYREVYLSQTKGDDNGHDAA